MPANVPCRVTQNAVANVARHTLLRAATLTAVGPHGQAKTINPSVVKSSIRANAAAQALLLVWNRNQTLRAPGRWPPGARMNRVHSKTALNVARNAFVRGAVMPHLAAKGAQTIEPKAALKTGQIPARTIVSTAAPTPPVMRVATNRVAKAATTGVTTHKIGQITIQAAANPKCAKKECAKKSGQNRVRTTVRPRSRANVSSALPPPAKRVNRAKPGLSVPPSKLAPTNPAPTMPIAAATVVMIATAAAQAVLPTMFQPSCNALCAR